MLERRLNKIVRPRDVDEFCGLRRTQRRELEKRGEFPKSVALSDNGRARGYLEFELIQWQRARLAKRDGPQ
jgi:predicted DNA-binding transcriptional regulator AlpA